MEWNTKKWLKLYRCRFSRRHTPDTKEVCVWPNVVSFLCWSHKLHGVGAVLQDYRNLADVLDILFMSPSLVRPETNGARRRRWVKFYHAQNSDGSTSFPPLVGGTQWGPWRDAGDFCTAQFFLWKGFVETEVQRKPYKRKPQPQPKLARAPDSAPAHAAHPGGDAEKKPLLYPVHDIFQKRPVGVQVRLIFFGGPHSHSGGTDSPCFW